MGLDAGRMWTIVEASRALAAGEISSVELTRECLARADAHAAALSVFATRLPEQALASAEQADRDRAAGTGVGPLHGIPFAAKDLLATSDAPTAAGSVVLPAQWAGDGDADSVARVRSAGAVLVGKSVTMEFACGLPEERWGIPVCRNPYDPARWTGGSSSGNGNGLATGMFLAAIGSDTAGSIRSPSAYCGITGLKPTHGAVPVGGCVPLSPSLDTVGPMARTAADCALLFDALAGRGVGGERVRLSDLRIGVDPLVAASAGAVDPDQPAIFAAATAALESRGARLTEFELPHYAEVMAAELIILGSEALQCLAPLIAGQWDRVSPGTRSALAMASGYTAEDVATAWRMREFGRQQMAHAFRSVDLIITPTSTVGAPTVDAVRSGDMSVLLAGNHTSYWNVLGNPALSVPIGATATGMPLAMQIVAPLGQDRRALAAGVAYQQVSDAHRRTPDPALWAGLAPSAGVPDTAADPLVTMPVPGAAAERVGLKLSPAEAEVLVASTGFVRESIAAMAALLNG